MDQDAAQSRITSLLCWGGGLLLAGYVIRFVVATTAVPGTDGATLWFLIGSLVMLGGMVALAIGLVAIGVRLGLAASGAD